MLFSGRRRNFLLRKLLCDPQYARTVNVPTEYISDYLSLRWLYNKISIIILHISIQTLSVIAGAAIQSTVSESYANVHASGFVFSLCKGFSNRNEQFVIYHICVKAILIKYDSYTGCF